MQHIPTPVVQSIYLGNLKQAWRPKKSSDIGCTKIDLCNCHYINIPVKRLSAVYGSIFERGFNMVRYLFKPRAMFLNCMDSLYIDS